MNTMMIRLVCLQMFFMDWLGSSQHYGRTYLRVHNSYSNYAGINKENKMNDDKRIAELFIKIVGKDSAMQAMAAQQAMKNLGTAMSLVIAEQELEIAKNNAEIAKNNAEIERRNKAINESKQNGV